MAPKAPVRTSPATPDAAATTTGGNPIIEWEDDEMVKDLDIYSSVLEMVEGLNLQDDDMVRERGILASIAYLVCGSLPAFSCSVPRSPQGLNWADGK